MVTAAASLPGARLVVVGDGPQRKQLERQLTRARFIGFQPGPELAADGWPERRVEGTGRAAVKRVGVQAVLQQ